MKRVLITLLLISIIFSQYPPRVSVNPQTPYYTNDTSLNVTVTCTGQTYTVRVGFSTIEVKRYCVQSYWSYTTNNSNCSDSIYNYVPERNPTCIFQDYYIINNSQNPQNLTDYQISIILNTTDLIWKKRMRSDCGDIRVYWYNDSSGLYEKVPYYIEEGTCNTSETKIWVRVPFIPANGTSEVYVEYGNFSLTSESNGSAVFDLFDDFEDGIIDTNKWTGDLSYATESNGEIYLYSTDDVFIISKKNFTVPVILEAKERRDGNSGWSNVGFRVYDENGEHVASFYTSGSYTTLFTLVKDGTSYTTTDIGLDPTAYRVDKIVFKQNEILFYVNGVLKDTKDNTVSGFPNPDLNYSVYFHSNDRGVYVDWVRIRKYADPEPIVQYDQGRFKCSSQSFSFNATVSGENAWKLCVKAYDEIEWTNTSFSPYIIDQTSPQTSANPSTYTSLSPYNVTLSCSDNLSGCNMTYYAITNSTSCSSLKYLDYPGYVTIESPGKWYVCAYSVDNAGNIESPKLFGPYYLLDENTLIYVGNLSIIISKLPSINYSLRFFLETNDPSGNFGIIYGYNSSTGYNLVFFNNSKAILSSCDPQGYCDVLSVRTFSVKRSDVYNFYCSDITKVQTISGNEISYQDSCINGSFGFVCKNCDLGLIGLTSLG